MKRISCIVCLIVIALLPSCKGTVDSPDKPVNADPSAVGFNVYVNRGLQTKAGWGGVLTLDDLKDGTKANGFGVFAYYGNGALYNETSKPDFMYDQQVTYNTTNNVWGYSPVKYWPNEFGEAASSEAADRLTFFAYAPFADVTPSTGVVTGDATTGIIGMSRNITAGDPVVMYSSSLTPGAGVDLCWGVAAEAFTSSVDGDNNNVAAGYPFLNVIKPKTGDHLKFEFNHALAQLNVQIDADINNEVADDGKTKIYVRSVTFNGFSMRGSLNLNSNTTDGPIWYDISGTGKLKREPVTVYDGRTDGMEGVSTASDLSEKPANLNPVIVQDKPYGDAQLSAGVTATAVNLFNGVADAPVMVIPTPGVPVTVTIVYDVETEDTRLTGYLSDGVTHGSRVENKITKTITTDQGNMILSAGKKYVVKLHLGLTSVKFDANVVSWDNTPYIPGGADLPANTTSIGSVTLTDDSTTPSIPYADLTIWKNETISTVPKVTVLDGDNNEIPLNKVDISWASNNTAVATVDATGAVTIQGAAGVAIITCTASQGEGNSKSASYNVNVNEVTGISLPATASVGKGSSTSIAATISHTGHGTITSTPTIAWASADEAKVAAVASSTTDNSATITGVTPGTANVTASVSEDCAASSAAASATCAVTCTDPSLTAFRGYDVSPGILKRNTNGTYELTSGTDPFEMYTIYDYDSDTKLSQYYFKWSFIVDENELGDGSNIIANSPKLKGWSFPSLGDMETIIKGTPKTDIKIDNNKLTTYPFAVVKYNDRKGVLLLRDGITLDGNIVSGIAFGVKNINTLSDAQYNHFLEKGCIILSFTGYHTGSNWYGPNIQYYGAVNFWLTNGKAVDLSDMAVTTTTSIPVTPNNQSGTKSFTIHLVKKL